ncbi:MAG: aldehyde dehydrogenase EutE [Deltaproteobacteria bacterium]|nr:aldehyde dehydrogenase EutE [Deltaproteobacteria bacterium]
MDLDEKRIQQIVNRVVSRLGLEGDEAASVARAPAVHVQSGAAPSVKGFPRGSLGVFQTIDDAVVAARTAYEAYGHAPLSLRHRVVQAMRDVTMRHVRELSEYAHAETGLGRVEDKIKKNTLAAMKTPGPERLKPEAFTGDHGLTIIEWAPYGVIGSITPTTNATETIINNGIGFLAAGNSAVFNVHPSARGVSAWNIHLLNEAIIGAGGPPNLLTTIAEPTIASANEMMNHPGVRLLVVTGGPGVVDVAMKVAKKVIAAGPGNPPVVVDETADLRRAGQGIFNGASFDNNIVCCDEKEVFACAEIFDPLRRELKAAGAYELSSSQIARLMKHIIVDGHTNKEFVGKNVSKIVDTIGIKVGDDVRLAYAVVDADHPLVHVEQLMPILPLVKVKDVDEAIAQAKRAEAGRGHSASVYTRNIDVMHRMAREMDTCLFIKNAPHYAGLGGDGEGFTSWTIAHPTGEGLTCVDHFVRSRRCTLQDYFRIV